MSWQAESLALIASGGMLAGVALISLHPRVALSTASRITYSVGAVVFLATALLSELVLDLDLPHVVLLIPIIPIAVIAVLIRDVVSASREPEPLTVIATSTGDLPLVAVPFGASGAGADRLLAESPYATPQELVELAYGHPELRPAIAANPVAPASLLDWLLSLGDPEVLAAISARPAQG